MVVFKKIIPRLGAKRTIKKVQETLIGNKARSDFLAQSGYPGQAQALMKRLHGRLNDIMPLHTGDRDLAAFGSLFNGPELMAGARLEPLAYPPAGSEFSQLWPWLSGQGALRLARANRLTGDFMRGLIRWLEALTTHSPPLADDYWQDNSIVATRAINLLFVIRFLDNPDKMPPQLCVDLLLHLNIMGQMMHPGLNNGAGAYERVLVACALMYLGLSFDFLPTANAWWPQGCAAMGPALTDFQNELHSMAQAHAALEAAGLSLWLGRKQNAPLPGLLAASRDMAIKLRAVAPPWVDERFTRQQPLLEFSQDPTPGQEANLAALLLSDPELRGPRQSGELLFWLLGPQVKENLRQLAGGPDPGALNINTCGLTTLSTPLAGRRLSAWLVSAPQPNSQDITRHALALALFRQGRPLLTAPLLLDKGPLAQFTRSRSAANTMVVDGEEAQGGAVSLDGLDEQTSYLFMAASYSGYLHLPDPVMLRRRVFIDKSAKLINIIDQIQAKNQHAAVIYFHFPPGALVQKGPKGGYLINIYNEKWWFKSEARAQTSLVSGQATPPLGWTVGPEKSLLPSPTICVSIQTIGSARLSCSLVLIEQEAEKAV